MAGKTLMLMFNEFREYFWGASWKYKKKQPENCTAFIIRGQACIRIDAEEVFLHPMERHIKELTSSIHFYLLSSSIVTG